MRTVYRWRLLLCVPLLVAGLVGAPAAPVSAATTCSGTINGGTIRGALTVPAYCALNGVTVLGNVTVAPGAELLVTNSPSDIRGNVIGNGANRVRIINSTVRGNITTTDVIEEVDLFGLTVRGNVVASNGTGRLAVGFSTIQGSLVISGNELTGGSQVNGNTIAINLVCTGNAPRPNAFNNTVGNNRSGQCETDFNGG